MQRRAMFRLRQGFQHGSRLAEGWTDLGRDEKGGRGCSVRAKQWQRSSKLFHHEVEAIAIHVRQSETGALAERYISVGVVGTLAPLKNGGQ